MNETDPVEALKQYYQTHDIELQALPRCAPYNVYGMRVIRLSRDKETFFVPVTDEYGDSDIESPLVGLHLVLQTCEYFEQAEGYTHWLEDIELQDTQFAQELYQRLEILLPELRRVLGFQIKAISDWDIQLGTAIIRRLRETKVSQ